MDGILDDFGWRYSGLIALFMFIVANGYLLTVLNYSS